jgi:hypothetical protein
MKVVSQSGVKAADINQQRVSGWYQAVLVSPGE